jgi:hypothetical protein
MKDNYQQSIEYFATLYTKNTIPTFSDLIVATGTLDGISFSLRGIDPALSDYPLHLTVNVKDTQHTLTQTNFEIPSSTLQNFVIPVEFNRCNTTKILSFELKDDQDTVTLDQEVYISCPVVGIDTNDPITANIYSNQISNQMTATVVSTTIDQDIYTTHLVRQKFNELFSKAFLTAISMRKIIL